MTYKEYATVQGTFCVDWDTCCQIIRSYHRARLQDQHSKSVTESQSSQWNPLTWGLPDLTYIEVSWDRVREGTTMQTFTDSYRLAAGAVFQSRGIDQLVRELKNMQSETRRLNHLLLTKMRRASQQSWSAIEKAVATYESRAGEAKLVRDLSGSILIGASTAAIGAAGGAALFGAGAGTVIKGTAKYQDTGNVGSAVIEATQNLAFAVFPAARGASLAGKEKVVKVVLSATADTGKALLEGRSLSTALAEGAVNVPVAVGGELAKKALNPILDRTAVPVLTKVLTAPQQVIAKLPVEVAKKAVEDRSKKAAQHSIRTSNGSGSQRLVGTTPRSSSIPLADTLSLHDELLLKFAVVDMDRGIGRSWW